jgi:hypothetical protein
LRTNSRIPANFSEGGDAVRQLPVKRRASAIR